MNNMKLLVNNYCIFSYKWKDNIKNKLKYIDKCYFKKINDYTINTLEVQVNNPFFKIIKLTIYFLHNDCLNLNEFNVMKYEDLNTILTYIENSANFENITKFTLNICENNNILTIMDSKYNLLKITDTLKQDEFYKPAVNMVSNLTKNILVF